eukprot:m.255352 g.255352  ORF g.255352 m.255352 type:complete len:86 (+) comp33929_c0_seq3:133-390(+)
MTTPQGSRLFLVNDNIITSSCDDNVVVVLERKKYFQVLNFDLHKRSCDVLSTPMLSEETEYAESTTFSYCTHFQKHPPVCLLHAI